MLVTPQTCRSAVWCLLVSLANITNTTLSIRLFRRPHGRSQSPCIYTWKSDGLNLASYFFPTVLVLKRSRGEVRFQPWGAMCWLCDHFGSKCPSVQLENFEDYCDGDPAVTSRWSRQLTAHFWEQFGVEDGGKAASTTTPRDRPRPPPHPRPAPETGEMSPTVVFPPLRAFLGFSKLETTLCAFERQEL